MLKGNKSSSLMAACVLCRQVARFRSLPIWRKGLTQAKHIHIKSEDDINDQQENNKENKPQEGYKLRYDPSSYSTNSANSHHQTDNEEEQCLVAHGPSFCQQGNRYSVSCSRQSSSSKSKLRRLNFNKLPEPEIPFVLPAQKKPVPPTAKVDSRAFLKCRPKYASMTLDLTQQPRYIDWPEVLLLLQQASLLKGKMKPSDVSHFLVEVSKLHPDNLPLLHRNQSFVLLLQYSVEHLQLFSQLQLLEVLQSFVWLKIPPSYYVLEAFESELSHRAYQMSLHQLLFAADLWRCMKRLVPQFLQQVFKLICPNLGQIGVPELIHLLYIMGEGRHCPKDLIHPLEQRLMRDLHQLHPEEIGTVCLGLFKSQSPISEHAVTRLVDRALCCVTEMSDFALVNVMKYLRFSYRFHRKWLEAMEQEVPQRVHGMSVQGLMHMALTCSSLHYHNSNILNAIAERIPPLVPHCRSKDSCKLLWAYGSLGFLPSQSPTFFPSLIEGLRQRKAEFQRYPEHLLTGLLGLAFISQFPEDLVALALSPEFISLALKNTNLDLKKDLFSLDSAVALEMPQWMGPKLTSELREEVADMLWKFALSSICQKPEVLEAESSLQDLLGGEQFVWKRMILPHTRSIDLEIHLDSTGQPIPVNPPPLEQNSSVVPSNQDWKKLKTGVTVTDELFEKLINVKSPSNSSPSSPGPVSPFRLSPDESGSLFDSVLDLTSGIPKPQTITAECLLQDYKHSVKVAVQVTHKNHFCSQSQHLLGLHAMKRRHLKISGYRVVELHHNEWLQMLRKSKAEKLGYLHCKIYNCL
ncbi:FAST kinase domain-containing protein 5, mitochondrial [Nematolebias whitei]|uniref:FAST kinase domain-containing protein 5, mitochondrial n=1 Tax=Nematolebias whitei TaxID=451745 RepID=UPI00189B3F85|nr:FAST kinase domain-containing protein 5, mitochondrial [Nematolebias whitei]